MIRSMTGFGKGTAEVVNPACDISVEIASVNRKQLEIRWTLPHEFTPLEAELRTAIGKKLSRGSVCVRLTVGFHSTHAKSTLLINQQLFDKVADMLNTTATRLGDHAHFDLTGILSVPGVLDAYTFDIEDEPLKLAVFRALNNALSDLTAMREAEGRALKVDIDARLAQLRELLNTIKPLAAAVPAALKQKLMDKLSDAGLPVNMNDDRMLKEVLFYADKCDAAEEITRLESHLAQFDGFLASNEPVGRSLDFLIQEMFREITTLSNKAGSTDITPLTVVFKSELEKIREQVQNIE